MPSLKQQCQALQVLEDFFLFVHEKSKFPKNIALFSLSIKGVFNKSKKEKYMRWSVSMPQARAGSYKYPKKSSIFDAKLNFLIMNRIKEVLNEKGIKQTWLAEKLGKSFKIVNAYACNRKQPSLETLFQIAELLQVNVKDLIVDNK